MKQITNNKSRAMTLTELLAVLMIISLLATIAVPVYVSRQEDARVRVAQGECREIAHAQETVAAMHGFYVPLQLLDDLPAEPDDPDPNQERIDRNPYASSLYLVNPMVRAEIAYTNVDQRLLGQGYDPPAGGPADVRVRTLVDNWAGPFLNFQRFWYDLDSPTYDSPTDPQYRTSNDMFRDFPLDPWGNPYRFYSPIGIIGDGNDHDGNDFNFENPNLQFSNGELTRNDDERFQRYAIVSYGRDGISDDDPSRPANAPYNDIYHEFGTDGLSRNFGRF